MRQPLQPSAPDLDANVQPAGMGIAAAVVIALGALLIFLFCPRG